MCQEKMMLSMQRSMIGHGSQIEVWDALWTKRVILLEDEHHICVAVTGGGKLRSEN